MTTPTPTPTPTPTKQALVTTTSSANNETAGATGADIFERHIPLQAGQHTIIKATAGQKYRVVRDPAAPIEQANPSLNAGIKPIEATVIATQQGADLLLQYRDGASITIEDFYTACANATQCTVTLPSQAPEGYTLSGDTATRVAVGDGSTLVYAHGEHDLLLSLTQGNRALAEAITALGEAPVLTFASTLSAVEGTTEAASTTGWLLAVGGVGAALISTGGAADAPAAVSHILKFSVTAGPLLTTQDLKVEVFKEDGKTSLGIAKRGADGLFIIDVGDYAGNAVAVVKNAGAAVDYMDEATGVATDLQATLSTAFVITGGTAYININPITTIAARQSGYSDTGQSTVTTSSIAEANTAVGKAFGLQNILTTEVVTTILISGDTNLSFNISTLTEGDKYGAALAALSGADKDNAGNSQKTIDTLVSAINSTGTLNADGQLLIFNGATTADVKVDGNLQVQVGILIGLTDAQVAIFKDRPPVINSVASDDTINAAEVGSAISGTNVAGSTVALTIGGNVRTATVTGTTWSYTLIAADITAMGEGAELLSARQTDAAGNVSSAGTRAITVDTLAPAASSAAPTVIAAVESGISSTEGTAGVAVTASLSGTGAVAGDSIALLINGSSAQTHLLTAAEVITGSYAFTVLGSTLTANASNTFASRLIDSAGNTGASSTDLKLSYDDIAPVVTTVTDATNASLTNQPVSFTVTFGEAVAGTVGTANFTATNGVVSSVTVVDSTHCTVVVTPTPSLTSGNVALSLVAGSLCDAAGNALVNADLSAKDSQGVDTLAPVVAAAYTSAENTLTDTALHTVTLTSTDANGPVVWSGLGGADAAKFTLSAGGVLSFNAATDFETKDDAGADGAYNVTVIATDAVGNATTQAVTVTLTDVNEAPTQVSNISAQTAVTGTAFTLNTSAYLTDPDTLATGTTASYHTLSYALTSGTLPTGLTFDTTTGVISGTASEKAANASYTVTATDGGNLSTTQTFTLNVVSAPTVASYTVTDNIDDTSSGSAAGALTFTVTFSEAVTVVTSGGSPSIAFNFGGESVVAAYGSGSGTTYTFTGTAPSGNSTSVSLASIALNGCTVTGNASHQGLLTDSVGQTASYTLDNSGPTVSSIVLSDSALKIGDTSQVTITFSETVTGLAVGDFTTDGGALSKLQSTDGGKVWTATLTPTQSTTAATNAIHVGAGSYADLAGNAGASGSSALNYSVDTAAPTVNSSTISATDSAGAAKTGNLIAGDHVLVTVAVSEATTVSGTAPTYDFTLDSATRTATYDAAHSSPTSLVFSYTIAAGDLDSSGGITAPANALHTTGASLTDLAGNTANVTTSAIVDSTNALAVDTTAPTVTSSTISATDSAGAAKTGNLIAGDHVLVTVAVSEATTVSGTAPTYDFTLDSATRTATYDAAHSSPTSLVFSYTIAAGDLDSSGGITAPANALHTTGASLTDLAGNTANVTTSAIADSTNALAVDTFGPTITNAGALDGQPDLDVTSDIVLNFGSPVTANAGAHLQIINDANSVSKAGYQGEGANHSIDLYLATTGTATGAGASLVTTYAAFQESAKTTSSGSVSISADGHVTLNPLYDLDLSNNYHIEIAAGSFTKASNGMTNTAFGEVVGGNYALNFSTVTPGTASAGSSSLVTAAASQMMASDGTLSPTGHNWISVDVSGLGTSNLLSSYQGFDLNLKNYALVMKNVSDTTGELGISYENYISLTNFASGDALYFDDQHNAGPIDVAANMSSSPSGALGSPANEGPLQYLFYPPTGADGAPLSVAFVGYLFDAASVSGQVIVA